MQLSALHVASRAVRGHMQVSRSVRCGRGWFKIGKPDVVTAPSLSRRWLSTRLPKWG